MKCEMPCAVLHDDLRRLVVDHVIVAALADRDALEQVLAVKESLPELQDVAFALQTEAELLSHGAGAAIAADQKFRGDRGRLAALAHLRCDLFGILTE